MYKKIFKRILDAILGFVLALILLIPGLVIAFLVKATSKGPVFFIQDRFGEQSEVFKILKFRTMATGTPLVANQEISRIDSFITPLGRILRSTSLDEIPQLINVIRGEMSFIGPRPLADTDMDVIESRRESGADLVKPGITGLAQVNGRNLVTNEEKAFFDSVYANNVSLRLDLIILFKTFVNVLLRTGINSKEKA